MRLEVTVLVELHGGRLALMAVEGMPTWLMVAHSVERRVKCWLEHWRQAMSVVVEAALASPGHVGPRCLIGLRHEILLVQLA